MVSTSVRYRDVKTSDDNYPDQLRANEDPVRMRSAESLDSSRLRQHAIDAARSSNYPTVVPYFYRPQGVECSCRSAVKH